MISQPLLLLPFWPTVSWPNEVEPTRTSKIRLIIIALVAYFDIPIVAFIGMIGQMTLDQMTYLGSVEKF